MDLGPNFGIPADPAANEYRLRHVGRISYPVFQVSLSVPASCSGKGVGLAAKIIHLCLVSGHGYRSLYYFFLSRYRINRYSDIYPSSPQIRRLLYAVWTPLSLRHHWSPPQYCSRSLRRRGSRERSHSQIDIGRYSKQRRLFD